MGSKKSKLFELLALELEESFNDESFYEEFLKYARYCDTRYAKEERDEQNLISSLKHNDNIEEIINRQYTSPLEAFLLLTSANGICDVNRVISEIGIGETEKLMQVNHVAFTLFIRGSIIANHIFNDLESLYDNAFLETCLNEVHPYYARQMKNAQSDSLIAIEMITDTFVPIIVAMMIDKLGFRDTLLAMIEISSRSFPMVFHLEDNLFGTYYRSDLIKIWKTQVANPDYPFEDFIKFLEFDTTNELKNDMPLEWRMAMFV